MNAEVFNQVITTLASRRPFRPFTVEISGGRRFEVDFPLAITVRDGTAVFLAPGHIPIIFDHESVTAIVDADANTAA